MSRTWKDGISVKASPCPRPIDSNTLGQGQVCLLTVSLGVSDAKLCLGTPDAGYSGPLCILRFSSNMAEILPNLSTLFRIPWLVYKRIKEPRLGRTHLVACKG